MRLGGLRPAGHLELPPRVFWGQHWRSSSLDRGHSAARGCRRITGREAGPGGGYLAKVTSPTLLIVGGADSAVLQLNQAALELIGGIKELVVVPDASHLFEEPGGLQEVARLVED